MSDDYRAQAVNRFEVIDEAGRTYARRGVSIDLSYQDGGRTLKVYVTPSQDKAGAPAQGECAIVSGDHPNPLRRVCFRPAVLRYPAMGGGYMLLCAEHGAKHARYSESWDGSAWQKPQETTS